MFSNRFLKFFYVQFKTTLVPNIFYGKINNLYHLNLRKFLSFLIFINENDYFELDNRKENTFLLNIFIHKVSLEIKLNV